MGSILLLYNEYPHHIFCSSITSSDMGGWGIQKMTERGEGVWEGPKKDEVIYGTKMRRGCSLYKRRMDSFLKKLSPYGYSTYTYFTQYIHLTWIYEENNPFLITFISIFCTTFIPKLLLLSSVSFGLTPPLTTPCHLMSSFQLPPPPKRMT